MTAAVDSDKMGLLARAGLAVVVAFGIIWMVCAGTAILFAFAMIIGSPIAVLAGVAGPAEVLIAKIELVALVLCIYLLLVLSR